MTNPETVSGTQGAGAKPVNPSSPAANQKTEHVQDEHCVVADGADHAAGTALLERPADGQSYAVEMEAGRKYVFDFAESDVKEFTRSGDDVTLKFADGSAVILKSFVPATDSETPAILKFTDALEHGELAGLIHVAADDSKDGVIVIDEPKTGVTHAKHIEGSDVPAMPAETQLAQASGENTSSEGSSGQGVLNWAEVVTEGEPIPQTNPAAIEPAAGDEGTAHKGPASNTAESVAKIEPAAGPSGGAGHNSNSGYGFNSSFEPQGVIPLNDVGPINPTALVYEIPKIQDDLGGFRASESSPEPKPPVPTFEICDQRVYEDGSVVTHLHASPGSAHGVLEIVISGIPDGWTVTGPGVFDSVAGTYTFTTASGADFGPGDNPTFSPPADSDVDALNLVFSVTETDTDTGLTGSGSGLFDIIVDAVADQPDITADDQSGDEGAVLSINLHALTGEEVNHGAGADDGSETITGYEISGVPDGFILSAGTMTSPGVYYLTPSEIAGLTITPGDSNFFGSIDLVAKVFTSENPVSDTDFNFYNNDAEDKDTFTLTWNPVIHPPCIDVNHGIDDALVKEDGSVDVPITAQLGTNPGPHEFLTVTVTGIDPSWGFSAPVGDYDSSTGTWTVILAPGESLDTLMTFTPPADSDIDLTGLVATATSTDPDAGISADSGPDSFQIIVDAVADAPEIVADDDSGDEGTPLSVDLHALTGEEVNHGAGSDDGSETIVKYQISGIPDGFTPSAGTQVGPGVWEFTPAEIAGLTITPDDSNFFGSIDLVATVFTTENPVDGEPQLSDNTETASDPFTLTWNPVIHPPCISVNNGIDDALVSEDGSIGVPVTAQLGSNPGPHEFLTVTITGIDPSWGEFTFTTGSYDSSTGTWTVVLAPGESLDTVLTFAPAPDSDIDLSGLVATATATDPDAGLTASNDDGFNVIVDAVADVPNVDGHDVCTEEGATVPFVIDTSVNDTDGSEVIEMVIVRGLPDGVTLTAGHYDSSLGGWVLVPAELAGLEINVPNGITGNFELSIESISFEQNTNGIEVNPDDNHASAFDTVILCVAPDDVPILVQPEEVTVDESDLSPTVSVTDHVDADFGSDTPGHFSGNGTSIIGSITSEGHAVSVDFDSLTNTYTGTAGGETVFTLVIEGDGTYTFNLLGTLDHPDGSNPDDILQLEFGVTATDSEGDSTDGLITVNVKDDAPVAEDDHAEFLSSEGSVSGNVVANDHLSHDLDNTVTKISFHGTMIDVPTDGSDISIDGDYGTLTINSSGDYTYVPHDNAFEMVYTYSVNNPAGSDAGGDIKNVTTSYSESTDDFAFSMTIGPESQGFTLALNGGPNPKGHEGEMALVYFDASGAEPVITIYSYNGQNTQTSWQDGAGAPGIQAPDAIISSLAHPELFDYITVTTDGSGNKVFSFALDATVLQTHDPVYGPDGEWTGVAFGDQIGMWLHPVSGLTTDYNSDGFLSEWSSTGQGWFDTSYQATDCEEPECVQDEFVYILQDGDMDTDPATLTIKTFNDDDVPVIANPDALSVDESDLGPVIEGSLVTADFGGDGPGTFHPTSAATFGYSGHEGPVLTSNNVPVEVTLVGDTYIGKAGSETIFTLQITEGGNYTFTLDGTLDHGNPNDPNDVIDLTFGVTATDHDGDSATATITVHVYDDAPCAVDDLVQFDELQTVIDGNVIPNDAQSEDAPNTVTKIAFNGVEVDLDPDTGATIAGDHGTLHINADGSYEYVLVDGTPKPGCHCGEDVFTYTLTDADGDSDTATLTLQCVEGSLIVGENVGDKDGSTVPHHVGGDEGAINGGAGADILVGDTGGSLLEQQTQDYNMVFMLDISGSMGNPVNANSRISLLIDAMQSLMNDLGSYDDGVVKVHMIAFNTEVQSEATFVVTDAEGLANSIAYLEGLTTGGYTNYEDPMQHAIDWLSGSEPLGGDAITTSYFISDGEPNRYNNASGDPTSGNAATVMAQLTGSDGTNEVLTLQGLSDEVIGVGINIGSAISNLNIIDSDHHSLNVVDPHDLTTTLADLNPVLNLDPVGDDVIDGGAGTDIIFGDVLFTDDLAFMQGLSVNHGSGWEVFERLEAGESTIDPSWSRDDTIAYIRDHAVELGQESHDTDGHGRLGGNDIIHGGAGDDLIFGQEGHDIISGDAGHDVIYGGSGADTFVFNSVSEGVDDIMDFNTAEGDVIDVSSILSGFDPLTDDIHNYVIATETGGNTVISVDVTGTAGIGGSVDIAVLNGVTGLDLDAAIKAQATV